MCFYDFFKFIFNQEVSLMFQTTLCQSTSTVHHFTEQAVSKQNTMEPLVNVLSS